MLELKSYTACSKQGTYLQINEDAVDVDLNNRLYFIFDGFGGSGVGDMVVRDLKENVKKFYTKVGGDPDATMPFFYSHKYLLEGNALVNAMKYAHNLLHKYNGEREINNRGGASAIGIAQSESLLTLATVGNCMASFYSKGHLKTVCLPDSFELLANDAFARQFKTTPLSAFGLFEELHLNIKELRPLEGDLLILLTDGAYARVDAFELKHTLCSGEEDMQVRVKNLFDLNNKRGNLDNQSALILQF